MTRAGVGVDALRAEIHEAVEKSSLRAVAEEIGMSWSGLRSFLAGTVPQPGTIAKLVAWRSERTPSPSRRDMLAAAEVLADYIEGVASPEGQRKRLAGVIATLADRLGPETSRRLQSAMGALT